MPERNPETPRRVSRVWVRPVVILIMIALAVFLAFYLSQARFSIREVSMSDDVVDVEIIKPASPPAR